jgi:hypothetical protein
MRRPVFVPAALLAIAGLSAQTPPSAASIAGRLTANALKAGVSFLASDTLEGRGTPSRGLDIAAEFVASQFRRAGLEPAGDDGYFQTADFDEITASAEGLALAAEANGETVRAAAGGIRFLEAAGADFDGIPVLHVTLDRPSALESLADGAARGKALVVEVPDSGRAPIRRVPEMAGRLEAAVLIVLGAPARGPAQWERLRQISAAASTTPCLSISDAAFRTAVLAPGARVSAHIPPPKATPVKLRNVIGVLRGADPALRDSYVLVTAHYDHLGIRGSGPGDHIYNGADDDASGTASAIEIAETLAGLPERPRRSVVFMTFFGEELGEVGSRYYVAHPVFPLAKTAVDLNLEQLGRTDEVGVGVHTGQYTLTGFEFTDLAPVLRQAAEPFGIRVVNDEKRNEQYFRQSDNYAFAEAGVPSTTISVAYQFSDYHQPGDEWPKLDYDNMAKVDRAVALAVWEVASNPDAPAWNAKNPKTEAFRAKRP